MKTIGGIGEVLNLNSDLKMFILESCPWMAEQWEPENIGYVFVLDDRDISEVSAIYDHATGYWNAVAILGEEYGCTVFLSSSFVASIPSLQERLQTIQEINQ